MIIITNLVSVLASIYFIPSVFFSFYTTKILLKHIKNKARTFQYKKKQNKSKLMSKNFVTQSKDFISLFFLSSSSNRRYK